MKEILCACNGKPCKGVCREKHLYRKRKWADRCPSAFTIDEKE